MLSLVHRIAVLQNSINSDAFIWNISHEEFGARSRYPRQGYCGMQVLFPLISARATCFWHPSPHITRVMLHFGMNINVHLCFLTLRWPKFLLFIDVENILLIHVVNTKKKPEGTRWRIMMVDKLWTLERYAWSAIYDCTSAEDFLMQVKYDVFSTIMWDDSWFLCSKYVWNAIYDCKPAEYFLIAVKYDAISETLLNISWFLCASYFHYMGPWQLILQFRLYGYSRCQPVYKLKGGFNVTDSYWC